MFLHRKGRARLRKNPKHTTVTRIVRNATKRRGRVCLALLIVTYRTICVCCVPKRTIATGKRRYRIARTCLVCPDPWRKRRTRGVVAYPSDAKACHANRDSRLFPMRRDAVACDCHKKQKGDKMSPFYNINELVSRRFSALEQI